MKAHPAQALVAPHIYAAQSQRVMISWIIAALLPSALWGIFSFGLPALLVLTVSIGCAVIGELLVSLLTKKISIGDGTSILTGLIIGLSLPSSAPLFIPAFASLFAILVVKWSFGGLGSNWMNPAMAGTAFAYLGWSRFLSSWPLPKTVSGIDGLSGSTPLLAALNHPEIGGFHPDAYAVTGFDTSLTTSLNEYIFHPLGAALPGGYIDLFVGNHPGAIGEVSTFLLLLCTVFLISRRIIRWEIPSSILASFALLTWSFGGLSSSGLLFRGDILFALCSGSVVFIAFFSSTDPVTSPMSSLGRCLYGLGIGCLIFLFRSFGSRAEGAAFSVIIMNTLVPLIDSLPISLRRKQGLS